MLRTIKGIVSIITLVTSIVVAVDGLRIALRKLRNSREEQAARETGENTYAMR